jgi:DNA-directed RNA polymerase
MGRKDAAVLSEPLLENADSPFLDEIKHERGAIERGYDSRRRKSEKEIAGERGARLAPAQSFTRRWHPDFVEDLKLFRRQRNSDTEERIIAAVIRAIKPERLAQLVMVRALSAAMKYPEGAAVQSIAAKIGQDIRAEIHVGPIEKAMREIAKNHPCQCSKCSGDKNVKGACQKFKRLRGVRRLLGDKETHRIIRVCRQKPQHLPDEVLFLNNKLYRTVGIKLIHRLAYCAEIEHRDGKKRVQKFAFRVDTVTLPTRTGRSIRKPLCLIPSRGLTGAIREELDRWRYRRPHYPFTVHQPAAWSDPEAGCYIIIRKGLIANGTREQYDGLSGVDLSRVYAGLDAMGSIPWQVTPKVAEVIEAIAQNKVPGLLAGRKNKKGRWVSAIGDIPPSDDPPQTAHPVLQAVAEIEQIKAFHKTAEGEAWKMSKEGREWRHAYRAQRDATEQLHSLRELWHLQLDAMRRAGEHKQIYFGHDVCFRTRAKTQELYFSYQGPDVMRGLLRFAQPGQMNDRARYWLEVNAANRYGHGWDKKRMDERAAFADEFKELISDTVRDPLKCMEWLKADEPIQFLSACLALHDDEHGRKVPVWQDATANGLQHFSAAGRDPVGAAMCNLVDCGERMNPHKICADATRPLLEEEGSELAMRIAAVLDPSLVKTPVTATPYGVTAMGMRDQLWGGFKEKGWKDDEAMDGSNLLCKFVAEAMKTVAPAAIRLMAWIRECAAVACKPTTAFPLGRPFAFYSPHGFPVIQPYRLETGQRVRVDGHSYYIGREDAQCPVNHKRQINGSAPNAVHSWDAAHGSATVDRGLAEGHYIPLIYDCIGPCASSVDDGRRIFREEFVKLHERDLVSEMAAGLAATYPDVRFPEPPAKGNFDLRHVLTSTYMVC